MTDFYKDTAVTPLSERTEVAKTVRITDLQNKYLKEKSINFSKFVRAAIDDRIEEDRITKDSKSDVMDLLKITNSLKRVYEKLRTKMDTFYIPVTKTPEYIPKSTKKKMEVQKKIEEDEKEIKFVQDYINKISDRQTLLFIIRKEYTDTYIQPGMYTTSKFELVNNAQKRLRNIESGLLTGSDSVSMNKMNYLPAKDSIVSTYIFSTNLTGDADFAVLRPEDELRIEQLREINSMELL